VSVVLTPFVYHNYSGYVLFCTDIEPSTSPPAWCHATLPSIYTYVQSQYWDVGFLRYWTLVQVPNFAIAAPPLAVLFMFSFHHLRHSVALHLQSISSKGPSSQAHPKHTSIFLHPALTPHAIHALFLCTTVLFTSHTQIILRLSPSLPLTYWAAAWLLSEAPKWGRWWVGWSLVWGALSVVLWGTGFPPA
jgi:phosphatidylinositol glycan class V